MTSIIHQARRELDRDQKSAPAITVNTYDRLTTIAIDSTGAYFSVHLPPAEVTRLAEILSESALLMKGEPA